MQEFQASCSALLQHTACPRGCYTSRAFSDISSRSGRHASKFKSPSFPLVSLALCLSAGGRGGGGFGSPPRQNAWLSLRCSPHASLAPQGHRVFSAVCFCVCVCGVGVRDVMHSHYVTDKKKQSWTKSPELSLWEKETETLLKCQTRVSVYCAR